MAHECPNCGAECDCIPGDIVPSNCVSVCCDDADEGAADIDEEYEA